MLQIFSMEVHFNEFKFQVIRPIVTIGTFDGVHRGHQSVIKQLKQIATNEKGESIVISFEPHPRHIVSNETKMPLLTTLTEKIFRFEQLGIDHLLVLSFTPELANLSYQDFFEHILLSKLHIHTILVGYDHKFGKNREGNFKVLQGLCQEKNIQIAQSPQMQIDNSNVSSSTIRELLQKGNIYEASALLSYDYYIEGKVIHGDKIGRTIGFPTANIAKNNPHKLTPAIGVYAVKVNHRGIEYNGMLNIGTRPSVSTRNEKKIEVHIFNFNKEIYNETVEIVFKKYIRPEYKFENITMLKKQLEKDMITIKNLFSTEIKPQKQSIQDDNK